MKLTALMYLNRRLYINPKPLQSRQNSKPWRQNDSAFRNVRCDSDVGQRCTWLPVDSS